MRGAFAEMYNGHGYRATLADEVRLASRMSDDELIRRFTVPRTKRSKPFQGRRTIADNSSIKKRMRCAGGFATVKMKPARVRIHWSPPLRQAWQAISALATDLEKDRARRRLMRYAA